MLNIKKIYTCFLLIIFTALRLPCCAQAAKLKVACIGNSVTYGFRLPDRGQNCYPAQLKSLLGDRYLVENFGHSGATLLRKGHNPYYKTAEFTNALAFKPDIAIIHLGLNDTDPRDWPDYRLNFTADYSWLIEQLRQVNPSVKIYVCLLSPVFSGHPRFKSGTRDWYDEIQALIPRIAAVNHTGLIDLYTPLIDRPDLFADNLHPNTEGASIIAHTVHSAITGDYGGLKLPAVFTDNMILQRDRPIPVYGTANDGDTISIDFANRHLTTVADNFGKWKVFFVPMHAGGPYQIQIKDKDTSITIKNILMGDVWLCSGQSNMAFPLIKSARAKSALHDAAKNPLLRLYQLKVLAETDRVTWDTSVLNEVNRLHYFSGSWHKTDSVSAADFSAVAYYFGIRLARDEHIPIGLIAVTVGGSPIESWIDRYTMQHDNLLVDELNNWRRSDFLMKFCRDRADTNLMLAASPKQRHPYQPCYNYEAGISRFTDFPIKGVIWYQGESNTHNPELYGHAFQVLVRSWRRHWGYQFPFYFVQLSGIDRPSWPVFRDMERRLQKQLPYTHFVVSMDVGDSLNVHYTDKKPVGERLALQALHYTYHQPIISDSPDAIRAVRANNKVIVAFAKGQLLKTADHRRLRGFELANDKGERWNASGTIRKNKVILTIPPGETIQSVWYAMQPFNRGNLANQAGLPATTFTIDVTGNSIK